MVSLVANARRSIVDNSYLFWKLCNIPIFELEADSWTPFENCTRQLFSATRFQPTVVI
jgi:hypothetical protein